jgi:hypothetical protein
MDLGDGGIGYQLSLYRLLDDMEVARRIREDGSNAQNLGWIIAQHNQLVERLNRLWNGCIEAGKEFERFKGELKQRIDERDARIQELEREVAVAKTTEYNWHLAAHDRLIANIDRWQVLDRKDVAGSQAG